MSEEKSYEKTKQGNLKISIRNEQDLMLPDENGNKVVGKLYQFTEQVFDKDKIGTFIDFIIKEKEKCLNEIKKNEQVIANLSDVKVDLIPEKTLEGINKYLGRSSKAVKKQMIDLNNYIARLNQKGNALKQLEFLNKQLKIIGEDLANVKKHK